MYWTGENTTTYYEQSYLKLLQHAVFFVVAALKKTQFSSYWVFRGSKLNLVMKLIIITPWP
jgi:hypothetical protein